MIGKETFDDNVVNKLIKHCHQHKESAEEIFKAIATDKKRTITVDDGELKLTDEHVGEFVERFSAEVGPTLYESKRRKS